MYRVDENLNLGSNVRLSPTQRYIKISKVQTTAQLWKLPALFWVHTEVVMDWSLCKTKINYLSPNILENTEWQNILQIFSKNISNCSKYVRIYLFMSWTTGNVIQLIWHNLENMETLTDSVFPTTCHFSWSVSPMILKLTHNNSNTIRNSLWHYLINSLQISWNSVNNFLFSTKYEWEDIWKFFLADMTLRYIQVISIIWNHLEEPWKIPWKIPCFSETNRNMIRPLGTVSEKLEWLLTYWTTSNWCIFNCCCIWQRIAIIDRLQWRIHGS